MLAIAGVRHRPEAEEAGDQRQQRRTEDPPARDGHLRRVEGRLGGAGGRRRVGTRRRVPARRAVARGWSGNSGRRSVAGRWWRKTGLVALVTRRWSLLVARWRSLLIARWRRLVPGWRLLVSRWRALLIPGRWSLLVAGRRSLLIPRWRALLIPGRRSLLVAGRWSTRILVSRWWTLSRWLLVAGRRSRGWWWVGAGRCRGFVRAGGRVPWSGLAGPGIRVRRFVRRGEPAGGWLGHCEPPGGDGCTCCSARCGQQHHQRYPRRYGHQLRTRSDRPDHQP